MPSVKLGKEKTGVVSFRVAGEVLRMAEREAGGKKKVGQWWRELGMVALGLRGDPVAVEEVGIGEADNKIGVAAKSGRGVDSGVLRVRGSGVGSEVGEDGVELSEVRGAGAGRTGGVGGVQRSEEVERRSFPKVGKAEKKGKRRG